MDETLIDQIVNRVAEKLAAAECNVKSENCTAGADAPKLLILTKEHGTCCHELLESKRIGAHFQTVCALSGGYLCDLTAIDTVVLFNLTNELLAKIADGVSDTPYTTLAIRALLSGKHIYLPREEVELYQYASTAPIAYYAMMEAKLKFLTDCGVTICPTAELESTILTTAGKAGGESCECSPAPVQTPAAQREQKLAKRVIVERDIISAKEDGTTRLLIGERAIVTDLARELAKTRGVEIVRE